MSRLLKYAKNYLFELIISCIGAFLFAFGYVVIIYYAFTLIFNFQILKSSDIYIIIFWIIATGLGNAIEHYLGHDIAFKVLRDFRIMVYAKMIEIGPSLLDDKDSSRFLQLIGKDIDSIEVFYAHTLVPIVRTISFMIAIFIFYLQVSFNVALTIFIISSIILIFSIYVKRKEIDKATLEYSENNLDLMKDLREMVEGKEQIIQLSLEDTFFYNVNSKNKKLKSIKLKKYNAYDKKKKILDLIYFIGFVLLTIVFYNDVGLDFKNISFLLIYPFIFEPYKSISKLPLALGNGKVASDNLFNFLNSEPLFTSQDKNEQELSIEKIKVATNKMSFAYNNNDLILKNVDISFEQGDRVGIFGTSGSGKTTLAKIIMKWYPYDIGSIKINDTELNNISQDKIRKLINYMPQNPDIFTISLRDNITMYNRDIKDEAIYDILDDLNLMNRIEQLDNGLDTIVNKDMFSSGEKQRLDLARALLNKSKILILDEPLSNLDSINGKLVLEYINKNYRGLVIIISHRYEAFDICNKVFEVKNKRLIQKI